MPATTPWGFTDNRIVLYYPPEANHAYPYYYLTYGARLQPGLTADDGADVVLSYNVNTTAVDTGCISASVHDADIYRPRFVDVPRSAFAASDASTEGEATAAPATVQSYGIENGGPAAFASGTAPASGSSRAAALQPQAGAGAGGTTRKPQKAGDVIAATDDSIGGVTDWYDYWATLQCPAIDAPGTPSVTANPDGSVDMSWNTVGTDVWYFGYQCDLTEGDCDSSTGAGFSKMWGGLWATTGSATTVPVTTSQMNGDSFEWYIKSFGAGNGSGGGDSPVTAPTAVTIEAPSAPTGLAASNTSGVTASGQVTLSWNTVTYPSTAVYYTPYYCDTSTSSCSTPSDFTAAPTTLLTITGVQNLNPGDTYDFYVTAENLGGTSPPSGIVSISASS